MTSSSAHPGRSTRSGGKTRFFIALAAGVLCAGAGLWFVLFTQLPGATATVQAASIKGVVDWRLEQNPAYPPAVSAATADQIIAQMTGGSGSTPGLHARWTRMLVYWDHLQPQAPGSSGATYSSTYTSYLKMIVGKLESAGVNVIVTPINVPRWASDSTLWSSPPHGYPRGVYEPFYAMRYTNPRVIGAFRGMAAYLATQLGPLGATKYEVWNEPNISRSLYPQRRGKKLPDYGMRVYRAMLQAYSQGIKSVNKSYYVIAGATAPYGNNSTGATSPNVWANNLRKHNMARYFDAYSHHPYTVVGSRNVAPNQMPSDPAHMVNLANLNVLLKMFPSKPFFLTEFGYGTGYSPIFGVKVSPAKQAAYLTKAYAMARSHRQVKALLWYTTRDWVPNPAKPSRGVFTGLMKADGTLKPAWTAFVHVP